MKLGLLLAFAFAVLLALAHLVRLAFRIPITIGGIGIPIWPSALAIPLFAGLALLIWRDTHPPSGRRR